MKKFHLSERSLNMMKGVDTLLVELMLRAIVNSPYDFKITCGLRTWAEQKELVKQGFSITMRSYHLRGKAVDIAILGKEKGTIDWDFEKYRKVADHIKKIAKEMGIRITWGGDWRKPKDGPHFQIEGRG